MKVVKLTREGVCDETTCPICKSRSITYISCQCLCGSECSCWEYPECNDCGFSAGACAGNSQGGIWISFSRLNGSGFYDVELNTNKGI